MTLVHYAPDVSMREARAQYFAANQFGADGGYSDGWVDFKLGPIPLPFPNTPARVRAVRYHDLHHVLTGYDTDIIGEFEISAWEIAAGCKGYTAAWQLNLGGMVGGVVSAPRRTFAAFLRGLHSRSLYDAPFDDLLEARVDELRSRMAVDALVPPPTVSAVILFVLALLGGLVSAVVTLSLTLLFLPIGLATFAYRRRKGQTSSGRAQAPHQSQQQE